MYGNPFLYGPYQNPPAGYPQMAQAQGGMIPPQQVPRVNGEASVKSLKMSPNSSVLLLDTTAPIVWLCTSDSVGNVTPQAYDITEHKAARSDHDAMQAALGDVMERVSRLEEMMDDVKPDDKRAKSKPAGGKPKPG